MVSKNLIIGGCAHYGIDQLTPWALSAIDVAGESDIVVVAGNTSDHTVDWLGRHGIRVFPMTLVPKVPVHVVRFLAIYEYLFRHWQDYDYVITTDTKDVYFQADPFQELQNKKLVVASECLRYQDEEWGSKNLREAYGRYVYERFRDKEIFNVGTFGGRSEYVRDTVFHIFTNAINRPIPVCDQAVFNVLMHTQPYKDIVTQTTRWACQAGTVADPSKISRHRPNLLWPEPQLENGVVTYQGTPYPIVHQYDRVPEWKCFVRKKYGLERESDSCGCGIE